MVFTLFRTAVGRPTAVRRPSAVRRPPAKKIPPKKKSPKNFSPENFDPEILVIHNQDPLIKIKIKKKKKEEKKGGREKYLLSRKRFSLVAKNICHREIDFLWPRKLFYTANMIFFGREKYFIPRKFFSLAAKTISFPQEIRFRKVLCSKSTRYRR